MAPVETTAIVTGAGPSGLAVAGCLRQAGVAFEVLDKADKVASAWHAHYERLHLHTARHLSSLPHFPWPDRYPLYPSRTEVIEYLTEYAARFKIAPRLGEEVVGARREGDRWEVTTRAGSVYRAPNLVVATGYNHTPLAPSWPGQETFRGTVIHSAQYRNGAPFKGKKILVVGIGNTGGEIAIDLHEHGATAAIAVRGPVHVVPRDFMGRPVQQTAIWLSYLPLWLRDAISLRVSKHVFGDLSDIGLRRPPYGPSTQVVKHAKIPLIDVGTIGLLRSGVLKSHPDVVRFTETGVVFSNGAERPFDAVVLATGYRPDVRFVEGAERIADERGYPRAVSDGQALPRAWFVGFHNSQGGLLRKIGFEAQRVAREMAA